MGEEEDTTKANIYVGTYAGGVGRAWLDDAAKRFEDLHVNSTHFQEGRTGVKIHVDASEEYSGGTLVEKTLKRDIYFTESVDYYKFVNRNKVANLSDIVTGSMEDYGEEGTIEDKLDPSFKAYLKSYDGDYYMLPFYDGFYGFIYDVELFEEEGFYTDVDGDEAYFKAEDHKDLSEKELEAAREEWKATLSAGPDGQKGTYDDGLPATYEELLDLVERINSKCTPFVYSGKYNDYVSKAFRSFAVDYEGYDASVMNYTFSGTASLVKTINADGTLEMEDVEITEENGYELQRQAGKYYALKMQEELFGSNKYLGSTWNSYDFTEAQEYFVLGKYRTNKYAILAEGVWWENEASAAFNTQENSFGEKKESRRFAFLPTPKTPGKAAGEQTLLSQNSSFAFIDANCENMELAKEFMRFLHTDAEMSKFSAKTSISRSLNYDVDPADRETATYFGQSVIDLRANSKVVYPYSSSELVIENPDNFDANTWFMFSTKGENPFIAFKNGSATAEEYFNGLYSYQKNAWKKLD